MRISDWSSDVCSSDLAGRIVQLGTPANLYYQPSDAFVASFFGDINPLEGVVEAGEVATPFCAVAAPGFPAGGAVPVLLRPEALHLTPLEDRRPPDRKAAVKGKRESVRVILGGRRIIKKTNEL